MDEDIEIWPYYKTVDEILQEVKKCIDAGNTVTLNYGTRHPEYELLEGIAKFWKAKKLTITIWNDAEFKNTIRHLRRLSHGNW